ncbi:MAG: hypothetical protein ACKO63_12820 [Nodosilinea sp.]
MLFPKPPFPTADQEFEACLTVVLRNLRPENWVDLISEAQAQMIQETEVLLYSELLSPDQALHLVRHWQNLAPLLTPAHASHVGQVLQTWQQTRRFQQKTLEEEGAVLLKDWSKFPKVNPGDGGPSHRVAS